MSRFTYEIDSNNCIRVWDGVKEFDDQAPLLLQPHWPNGDGWASLEEAENWVSVFIQQMEDPEYAYLPGNSRDLHPQPKPEPEIEPEQS